MVGELKNGGGGGSRNTASTLPSTHSGVRRGIGGEDGGNRRDNVKSDPVWMFPLQRGDGDGTRDGSDRDNGDSDDRSNGNDNDRDEGIFEGLRARFERESLTPNLKGGGEEAG